MLWINFAIMIMRENTLVYKVYILKNILILVLKIFLCLEALESNTTSDWSTLYLTCQFWALSIQQQNKDMMSKILTKFNRDTVF